MSTSENKPQFSSCYRRPKSCEVEKDDSGIILFDQYRSLIYTKLATGGILFIILLGLIIFIFYLICKLFYQYTKQFYAKHDKFLESKGLFKNNSDYKFDDETYLDRKQEEKLKYYEDMSYDSITKEISQNIEYHTKDSKEHIKRLEDYIKNTGHEIPLDTIDHNALLPEDDDY